MNDTPFPTQPLIIRPFQPADQAAVKALILAGLKDHWGWIDPTLNPDLNDIATTYAAAYFLTAHLGERIVGSGALVPRGDGVGEIVRMSTAHDLRRQGVGRQVLQALIAYARQHGYRKIMLETTETWDEVIRFYLGNGFKITHYTGGDVYFQMLLDAQPPAR